MDQITTEVPDTPIIKVGRALFDSDARAASALTDRSVSPIEATFRSQRIRSLADQLAASALEGLTLDRNQAACLRAMAQICWILEDHQTDSFAASRWHDLGQELYKASHILLALNEDR